MPSPFPLRPNAPRNKRAKKNQTSDLYESLEPRRLLANLALTDSHIGFTPKLGPIIVGEQIGVSAVYSTENLASGAVYDIKFSVNGYESIVSGVTNGASAVNEEFKTHENTWTVGQGTTVIEVWLDINNDVDETDESDNYRKFEFTTTQPDIAPFVFPWQGEMFQDIVISNHPGISPNFPYVDHRDEIQYSNSLQLNSITHEAIDEGIPVFAMADGTVTSILDGNPDRYTPGTQSSSSNTVRIAHGGDHEFQTIIQSFRRDSIVVERGDSVVAGQFLGYMSGSVYDTNGKSRFIIFANGGIINPFIDASTYWQQEPGYAYDQKAVYHSRITNYADPERHAIEGISEFSTFHQNDQSEAFLYAAFGGLRADDVITYQWKTPTGIVAHESTSTMEFDRKLHRESASWQLPDGAELGEWSIAVLVNDIEIHAKPFKVTTTRQPELRIEESNRLNNDHPASSENRLVSNGRHSAFDLGRVTLGGDDTVFHFELINHGNADLNLTSLVVPNGFTAIDDLPPVLAPGQTDTLSIQLDQSVLGYRIGTVVVGSDDASEPFYEFWVEGGVVDATPAFPSPGYFTLGTSERKILEGGSMVANLLLPGPSNSELTFDLTYSSDAISGPASVTFPINTIRAVVQINASDLDLIDSGSEKITITATLVGGDDGDIATAEVFRIDAGGPQGTEGDDIVELFLDNANPSIEINGENFPIDFATLSSLSFDSFGGFDQLVVHGDAQDNFARIAPGVALIQSSDLTFRGFGFENVNVLGNGGNDIATLVAASGINSTLESNLASTSLVHGDRDFSVRDFTTVRVFADNSADNTALLSDTPGDDVFYGTPTTLQFRASGKAVNANGFRRVTVESSQMGDDRALLIGTAGDDEFFGSINATRIRGFRDDGLFYRIQANAFRHTTVRSLGGNDIGNISGSNFNEDFFVNEAYARMTFVDRIVRVDGINELDVQAGNGVDHATIVGTQGDDNFVAFPEYVRWENDNGFVKVNNFDSTVSLGGDGNDTAQLFDSEGDDNFVSRPTTSWMVGSGYRNRVIGIERVDATASEGHNQSFFFGSEGDDRFVSVETASRLISGSILNSAVGFQSTRVELAQGGFDIARLIDTPLDDRLIANGNGVTLVNESYQVTVVNPDRVIGVSTNGGRDEWFASAVDFDLIQIGEWV